MKHPPLFLATLACLLLLGGCAGGSLFGPTPTPDPTATPVGYLEGWTLTWHDEFDGPALDSNTWIHEIGGNGWGNGEAQYYTDSPDNAFIENGNLVIQALEHNKGGNLYTSARLVTKGTMEQQHGRIEARIQIPRGQGIWPAFWMLGNDFGKVSWPFCGEIDIMENIGREPNLIHGTVHGPGYSGANGIGKPYAIPGGAPFADDSHVFAVEWEPQAIRWYMDDTLYNTVTPDDVPGDWVYDHPFFIILNVAVGGRWPGYPDDTTVFPQRMTVDYVRVYERP